MERTRTLRQCLVDTDLVRLRVIARLWGLEVKGSRPIEVAAGLSESMADPAHAADIWRTLRDDEQAALSALLDAGGELSAAVVKRRFSEIRPIGPGRLEVESPWRDPVSPAEGLWYRGLIYEGFSGNESEAMRVFFVPDDLGAALPVQAGAAAISLHLEPTTPPTYLWSSGEHLLDDLTTVLAFVHNEVVSSFADAPGAWPKEPWRRAACCLRNSDAERLQFMLHLIDHLGWTRGGVDGRLRLVAEAVMAWLETPSRAVLVGTWRQMTTWDELWRLTPLRPDDTGTWRHDPTLARAALVRHLHALTSDEWFDLADLIGAIKEVDPDFQRPGGDYEAWYVRDPVGGAYLTGFESWDQVEGALLRALMTGPAWWLGLVDLGSEAEGEPPKVFRTRPANGAPESAGPQQPDEAPPVVRPDLTVTMPTACRLQRFQLARVADLLTADDLYVYRITPGSLHRARQQRIDVERVLGFLDGLSDAPLPNAVQSSLTRWAERGTEVWLEQTVILSVVDEGVMQQIVASPRAGPLIGRLVGPTTAMVAERDWPKLVGVLAELGLLAELGDW